LIDAESRPRILIVDDEPINVKVLVDLLRPKYGLVIARDGVQALERLKGEALPDLALVDVMMPNMDGLELCRRMKRDPRLAEAPVIFVSALGQSHDEADGFEAGAVDYVTKPISPPILLARVRTHLALRRAARELIGRNRTLEEAVRERTAELALTQAATIQALTTLVESRDQETGGHILRTQRYVGALAQEMRRDPRFVGDLDDHAVDLMCKSAPLHDIGKVAIPDSVLLKAGKLTAEEFEVMKTHTTIGRDALTTAQGPAQATEFLRFASEIAGGHHEKWDGSGYPLGLAGEAIPLSARLMAMADVYDALRCARVYKRAMSHAEAREIILAGYGRHFDPGVVDAFVRCESTFEEIARALADPEPAAA
jgi:putative two-component system response regulator